MEAFALKIVGRWRVAWRDALASAVAAILSWVLAQHIFGHSQPIFAAITAIVCLAPGLPSHGKQVLGLLIGVATGIVVGEWSLFLPDTIPLMRIGVAAFLAIFISTSYGLPAVVPIQAGVSAILVLAFGPATAGSVRMLEVALGSAVGLVFSQAFLTSDPVRMVDAAARDLLTELAKGLRTSAEALRERSEKKAQLALTRFSTAHRSVIALDTGIADARSAVRWSLRGWLAAREVKDVAARYDRRAIRLYASTLLFGEALANAFRKNEAPPPGDLHERVARVANRCVAIANGKPTPEQSVYQSMADAATASPAWRICMNHLQAVEDVLLLFEREDVSTRVIEKMSDNHTVIGRP